MEEIVLTVIAVAAVVFIGIAVIVGQAVDDHWEDY